MDQEQKHKLVSNMISFYSIFQKEIADILHNNSREYILSPLLYKILHEINLDRSILPSDLSRRLSVSVPNISRSLHKLYELGYITKTKDGTDKRITHLDLTLKGIDMVEESLKIADDLFGKRLDTLTEDEIKQLSDAFSIGRDLLIKD